MSAGLPRAVMALAVCCWGDRRRGWADAMAAEFEMALEDGRPLSFAAGCLLAACRALPGHRQGRFLLASHGIALGLILPMAALMLWAALLGYPFLQSSRSDAFGLPAGDPSILLLNAGNIAIAPSLTALVLLLAATHPVVAWLVLERDWERAAAVTRLGAAATTTLLIFTAVCGLVELRLLLPVACLAAQTLAVLALARWHAELPDSAGFEAPA